MGRAQELPGPPAHARALVRLASVSPISIVPEGPIAWRQALPLRRWFVSQIIMKRMNNK